MGKAAGQTLIWLDNMISLSLEQAHAVLKRFDCVDPDGCQPDVSDLDWATVQLALRSVVAGSDYQMFGVCAESIVVGMAALQSYLQALGLGEAPKPEAIVGPAYVKYNPKSGTCYASAYPGNHRGVLVSCQSETPDGVNQMYGHLPLDLFAN